MQAENTDGIPTAPTEGLRKIVHIGIGLFAITLKWLPPMAAAGVAAAGFLFNWLVLPRIGGRSISRADRGMDRGILVYPLAVLALILIFRNHIAIAAVAWVCLAFGDGSATLVGKNLGGPKLPWNREKSLAGFFAFIEVALPLAFVLYLFLEPAVEIWPRFLVVAAVVIVAAIVESLHLGIDDNLTVPFAAAATMYVLTTATHLPTYTLNPTALIWLGVNLVLAVVGYVAKSVNVSGAIGGFVLGCIVILFGHWQLYVVLLAFFVLATSGTKLGYRRKAKAGLAQEEGGRRGFSHAFSNVGVTAICAILAMTGLASTAAWWLAAAAALVTATVDTMGSEIGQLIGRRAYLPLTFRRVDAGTEGAVSLEGTIAGLLSGIVVAVIAVVMWASLQFQARPLADVVSNVLATKPNLIRVAIGVALLTGAGFAGSYVESIAGSFNRKMNRPIPNGVLNFFNTAVGATIVFLLVRG